MRKTTETHIHRKQGGFTLIEVMVVLIIMVILSVAALPSYKSFIVNQRIKSASFDMIALMTFTRNEAMKRNAQVTFDPLALTIRLADGSIIRQESALTQDILLSCIDRVNKTPLANCPTTGTNPGITFNGNGRVQGVAYPPMQIYAKNAPDTSPGYYRCITVDPSGRPNSKKGPC